MTNSLYLYCSETRFIEELGGALSSRLEVVRMALYFTKYGLITPKKEERIDGSEITSIGAISPFLLKDCKNKSKYIRECLYGLEHALKIDKVVPGMEGAKFNINNEDLDTALEITNEYNISFSELTRYSLFMHYYLNIPLGEEMHKPLTPKTAEIPLIIKSKMKEEKEKYSSTIQRALSSFLYIYKNYEVIGASTLDTIPLKENPKQVIKNSQKASLNALVLTKIENLCKKLDYNCINKAIDVYKELADKIIIRRGCVAAIVYYAMQLEKKDTKNALYKISNETNSKMRTISKKAKLYRELLNARHIT